MLVRFKQDWFGPGEHLRAPDPAKRVTVVSGHLYKRTQPLDAPTFVPDEYRDLLPYNAVIVGDGTINNAVIVGDGTPPPPASRDPVVSLKDFDDARASVEAVIAFEEKTEAARVASAHKPRRIS